MSHYEWKKDRLEGSRMRRLERATPYFRRGSQVSSPSSYGSVLREALTDGLVDPTSEGVVMRGSVPPNALKGVFAATATDSAITIYWDGTNQSEPIVIGRADGSSFSVPAGSLTVNGLKPNKTYYFYPYWRDGYCAVSWVIGDEGNPKVAFVGNNNPDAIHQQNLQSREALSGGAMTFSTATPGSSVSTPSLGGGGGVSGGGGGGFCVLKGTIIDPLAGECFIEEHPQDEWWRITTAEGIELIATPNHPVYTEQGGRTEMADVCRGDSIITLFGFQRVVRSEEMCYPGTKVAVEIPDGHAYWANGVLSHNVKIRGDIE